MVSASEDCQHSARWEAVLASYERWCCDSLCNVQQECGFGSRSVRLSAGKAACFSRLTIVVPIAIEGWQQSC